MRYFLEDFEKVHNNEWPFGQFPAYEYYKSTGTHIGTDFKVPVGTPVFAPADGEMFKVEYNRYKGNVGVYIFKHEDTEWALELCHLRELPQVGNCKEDEIIAYSGMTGESVDGAHLHAVLHRDAQVTKNYQDLLNREAFLRLEKEGRVVDCLKWFCSRMQPKQEAKTRALEINVSDTIAIRDSMELKTFAKSVAKFIAHIISGWFPSKRTDLSPDGVQKERLIDRVNNRYKEKVVDVKTHRVIRSVDEKLTDHRNRK